MTPHKSLALARRVSLFCSSWLVLTLVLWRATAWAGELTVQASAESLDNFQPLFLRIGVPTQFQNPHDAAEIQLEAVITLPDGTVLEVPCFHRTNEASGSRWEGRFTPRQPGRYQGHVRAKTTATEQKSAPFKFTVQPSAGNGFLQVASGCMDALVFDSGRSFRGLGSNVGWEPRNRGERNRQHTYQAMFPMLAQQGANFVRTWMCPWNMPLEWKKNGPGRYDEAEAAKLDDLLALAREQGIYLMLALDYHGVLRTRQDYWGGNDEWKNHPYNVANGGPCQKPAEFFTHPEARRLYKNRLRYLVARWSYHSHLAVWEFWNEIDIVRSDEKVPAEDILDWHREMAAYLHSIDPSPRPVSTSLSHGDWPELWRIPSLDFTMVHAYGETTRIPGLISSHLARFQKPAVIGEFAFSWKAPNQIGQPERYAEELHLGLWRGLLSPTPIVPLTWWWEHHEQRKEFASLKAVRQFQDRMLLKRHTPFAVVSVPAEPGLDTLGLRSGNALFVWCRNGSDEDRQIRLPSSGLPPACSVLTLDTQTGDWTGPMMVTASNDILVLPAPHPKQDRAYVIGPPPPTTQDWARALQRQLRQTMLPYWLRQTVDTNRGGFLLADDLRQKQAATQKQVVGQSRMIWGFSQAHRQGLDSPKGEYLEAADQGYRFLTRHFLDRQNGGYFWTTDLDGKPLNDTKILYGQSFVLYGLVEYYRASTNREALERALELYQTIQDKAHDTQHGGWVEHFQADWQPILSPDAPAQVEIAGLKSANTHLHLMEAFTELFEVTQDPRVKASLEEALRLNQTWFYPPDPAQSAFHRHPDGQRATGPRSDGLSYGHNVEFAWLMIRAQKVLGQTPSWIHFQAHLQHALRYGYDHERGGLYNKGFGNQPAHDTEKVWWVQAELIAALTDALQHQPIPAHESALLQTLQFAQDHLADPADGVWIASVSRFGGPKWTGKAHDWKANYHDVRALLKFVQAFLGSSDAGPP